MTQKSGVENISIAGKSNITQVVSQQSASPMNAFGKSTVSPS
jgi:hypothetical protein